MVSIISIDGNIGCGKSTIIENLKKTYINDNIIFLEEPLNEWNKIKDGEKTILEKYYENIEKYGFCFQMMTFITRYIIIKDIIDKNPNAIIVTERSLYTDKYIFAKMLYETKKLDNIEYQVYNKWFNQFINTLPPHKYIYILSDPTNCLSKIKYRNRKGESNIDIEYLELCKKSHDEMFTKIQPDMIINNDNYDLNSIEYNCMLNQIRTFIINQPINNNELSYPFIIITYCIIFLLLYLVQNTLY
jgi:deoxyadenosine/deoxycytidine kinase